MNQTRSTATRPAMTLRVVACGPLTSLYAAHRQRGIYAYRHPGGGWRTFPGRGLAGPKGRLP